MAMNEYRWYRISYRTDGNEHFPPEITWYVELYAKGFQEALVNLYEIEKNNRITEIVRVSEGRE